MIRRRTRRRRLYRHPRYAKRTFRFKRRFKKRQRMSYNIQRTLINADTQYVKLRYTENNIRNPAAFADVYVMSGNSLYDPNVTGIGAQPAGFDQWMLLYSHYQVLASKITVLFTNLSAVPFQIVVRPSINNVNIGIDSGSEQAYAKTAICSAVTARGVQKVTNFMRSKKLFGRILSSVNYSGTSTSSPAVQWYWYTNTVSSDNSNNLNYSFRVSVTYYVKFWQRNYPQDA